MWRSSRIRWAGAALVLSVVVGTGAVGTYASHSDFSTRPGAAGATVWVSMPPLIPNECGGMAFDNVIVGTDGPDLYDLQPPEHAGLRNLVFGLGGDDLVRGGNQDDCLVGGDGADKLFGENGKDVLIGGNGGDSLDGGNGSDELYGAGGDDVLVGGNAPDTLSGGDGEDLCSGGHSPDVVLDDCEVVAD